ncbi:MAG: hypothetical protein GXO64_00805 [Candidatus Micrarchaeota archaeon]|nr:hypothetical protein [Candidatus Micrarchaeota archaeon]
MEADKILDSLDDMKGGKELARQLIHLSGILFVIAAQILGGILISIYAFMAASFFFMYSIYLKYERRRMNRILRKLDEIEERFRDMTLKVARIEEERTGFFHGPFWLFMGFGITFALFPLPVASASCAILAVGDSASTIVGMSLGKHKIAKNKTIEGTSAFLISSFIASIFFVNPVAALLGSSAGAIAEAFGRPNDNITIPLASAVVMIIAMSIL